MLKSQINKDQGGKNKFVTVIRTSINLDALLHCYTVASDCSYVCSSHGHQFCPPVHLSLNFVFLINLITLIQSLCLSCWPPVLELCNRDMYCDDESRVEYTSNEIHDHIDALNNRRQDPNRWSILYG